jgi:DNA polymerase-1
MANDCIYVIDVFSLMFQVFHAIPPMTGTQGQPTNAVFGFARDLFAILAKQPTHIICAFDSSGPGRRNEIYDQYKANRDEMPEDLRPQIPLLKQMLEGFHIPSIELQGWEADDVIATVTQQAKDHNIDVVIVSSDKDTRQLISPTVRVYNNRKDTFLDEQGLMDDWGIRADQVVDYQSLVGDSVDNVPGVPLVGPKKAKALIEQFGTLENILANADKAPGKKLSQNLVEFADQARMSRELVTLRTDLPLDIDFDAAKVSEPDRAALYDFFTLLGFRRYSSMMKGDAASDQPRQKKRSIQIIDSDASLKKAGDVWKSYNALYVALKFTSGSPRTRQCIGLAFALNEQQTWYAAFDEDTAALAQWQQSLLQSIADYPGQIVTDAAKPLVQLLLSHGISAVPSCFDLPVADYLLDAGERHHDLKSIVGRRSATNPLDGSEAEGSGAPKQQSLFESSADQNTLSTALDRSVHAQQLVAEDMRQLLDQDELTSLYDDLERPLIDVLARMEFIGIRVDVEELNQQCATATEKIDQLTAEIYQQAGREFNIDSPKQLSQILFDELGLPVIKKTKTGASTDQEVLETLAPMHALPSLIVERRHLAKLRGTYLEALPRLVNEQTGRIHTTFHQTVASTGRLSSSDPNLQNIPIRTAEGRQIRKAFVAGQEDWQLLCADYSQIELRVLAHFSQDQALLEAFHNDIDIHSAVAAEVFHVPLEEVTSDLRRVAKAVNFGVIYGQSPFGLANALGIEKAEAAGFIEGYFARYPGVEQFCEKVLSTTQQTGFARTILNRRRAISGIRNVTGIQRNMPERTAINTVVQGSAADLMKRAMLNVDKRLGESDLTAEMLMQIHDELVFECPPSEFDRLQTLVVEEMTNAMQLDVPIVVDVTRGPNWLEQEPC